MLPLLSFAAGAASGLYIAQRTRNQRRAAERIAAATLETLLNAIDANDAATGAHVRRVAAYAVELADAAGLDDATMRTVERIALFHDIGKIHAALFDIVHEAAQLTRGEWRAIATHPARGARVLAPLAEFYPDLAAGVLAHHECWDGSGYPRKLRGRQIPLAARIVSIADTFDVITHGRLYRAGTSVAGALRAIGAGRGTQFDPDLVDLFLLPPVTERIVKAMRGHYPALTRPRRSAAPALGRTSELRFRWRTAAPVPPLPGPPPTSRS